VDKDEVVLFEGTAQTTSKPQRTCNTHETKAEKNCPTGDANQPPMSLIVCDKY